MHKKPLVVYLDNQDYSNMANPNRHANEPDLPVLLAACRAFKATGRVKFVFSAVNVAEALPMSAADVDVSRRQVQLIRELCGEHALVNYYVLVLAELQNLGKQPTEPVQAIRRPHDWMPAAMHRELASVAQPHDVVDREATRIVDMASGSNMGADVRSAAIDHLRPIVRKMLLEQRQTRIDSGEFFYLKPEYRDMILRSAVGEASSEERTAAYVNSWNDLEWIVGLYELTPHISDWFRDVVRNQNSGIASALRRLVARMDGQPVPDTWKSGGWNRMRDNYLLDTVRAACEAFGMRPQPLTSTLIKERCPGFTAEAEVVWSLAWSYLAGGMKKEILNSSAADAMQAIYAPYVDVFRADKSMAPHVARAVTNHRTVVVGDRRELIGIINKHLLE